MDALEREGGKTYGDIIRAVLVRSGITNPFAGMCNNSLSCGNVERSRLMFDAQRAPENDGEFVEGRSLSRFDPPCRTAHMGDTCGGGLRIDPSNVFVDELGLVARGLNAGWLRDERRHGWIPDCDAHL